MNTYLHHTKSHLFYRLVSIFITITFIFSSVIPPSYAQVIAAGLNLPAPGTMVALSPSHIPVIMKGVTLHPENPLKFDFIIDTGDDHLEGENFRQETDKLIKYFLTALTLPSESMWVNLSPYEKDRIIPDNFGQTEMGRDLLIQDYFLKQLTASLIYPEEELGNEFWQRVYKKVNAKFGNVDIPLNTFNKIWIVPDKALVYEEGKNVVILESHLNVMLEQDYEALRHERSNAESRALEQDDEVRGITTQESSDMQLKPLVSEVKNNGTRGDFNSPEMTQIIREILIPAIEVEVNNGKNFANLRQIYSSMILATWYKKNLKESFLGKTYVDQAKMSGIETVDSDAKEKIYAQYLEAFKLGVYNYIKEEYDPNEQQMVPRKYFSGGARAFESNQIVSSSPLARHRRAMSGRTFRTAGTQLELLGPDSKERSSSPVVPAELNSLVQKPTIHKTDVFIVGAGLAGIMAAMELAKKGKSVSIASKVPVEEAHSRLAQGGVAAAIGEKDSFEIHLGDTTKGAAGLADYDGANILVRNAVRILKKVRVHLKAAGWEWDLEDDGNTILLSQFGGQSVARTHSAGDKTGLAMHDSMYTELRRMRDEESAPINVFERYFVKELIKSKNGRITGVVTIDLTDNTVHIFKSKAVILATGGAGQVFRFTSNPIDNTGDGNYLASEIGVPIRDLEFFQFHPSGMPPDGHLVSERARAKGGVLRNSDGKRFMFDYIPDHYRDQIADDEEEANAWLAAMNAGKDTNGMRKPPELLPRDIVSRAIATEIREGRGVAAPNETELKYVHIDMTDVEDVAEKMPGLYEYATETLGIDPQTERVPIRPTSHYTMGGVPTDTKTRVLIDKEQRRPGFQPEALPGLYAAGETANVSVHGANRLGTNSLLETLVYGEIAARTVSEEIEGVEFEDISDDYLTSIQNQLQSILGLPNTFAVRDLIEELRETMQTNVGVFRAGDELQTALEKINAIEQQLAEVTVETPEDFVDLQELRSLLRNSKITVVGAIAREESRGGHARVEYPQRDDEQWRRHTLVTIDEDGEAHISYMPVVLPGEGLLEVPYDYIAARLERTLDRNSISYKLASVFTWLDSMGSNLNGVSVSVDEGLVIKKDGQTIHSDLTPETMSEMSVFQKLLKFLPPADGNSIQPIGIPLNMEAGRDALPTHRYAWVVKRDAPQGTAEVALDLEIIPMPTAAEDEVIIEVQAAPSEANPSWATNEMRPIVFGLHKHPYQVLGNNSVGRIAWAGAEAVEHHREVAQEVVTHNLATKDPLAPNMVLGLVSYLQSLFGFDSSRTDPDAALKHGGYAQFFTVKWWQAMPKAADQTYAQAAVAPLAGPTIHNNFGQIRFSAGMTFLLTGASGSTGSAAINKAIAEGAKRIIGVVSTDAKARRVERKSTPQTEVVTINRTKYNMKTEVGVAAFEAEVLRLNGGEPVDVALDALSGPWTNGFFGVVKRGNPNDPNDLGGIYTSFGADLGDRVSFRGTGAETSAETMLARVKYFRDRPDMDAIVAKNREIWADDAAAQARIDEAVAQKDDLISVKRVVIQGADEKAMEMLEAAIAVGAEVVFIVSADDVAKLEGRVGSDGIVGVLNINDYIGEGRRGKRIDLRKLSKAVQEKFGGKNKPDVVMARADTNAVLGIEEGEQMLNVSLGLLNTGGQVVFTENTEGKTFKYSQLAWVLQKSILLPDASIVLTFYHSIGGAFLAHDEYARGEVAIDKPTLYPFIETPQALVKRGQTGKNVILFPAIDEDVVSIAPDGTLIRATASSPVSAAPAPQLSSILDPIPAKMSALVGERDVEDTVKVGEPIDILVPRSIDTPQLDDDEVLVEIVGAKANRSAVLYMQGGGYKPALGPRETDPRDVHVFGNDGFGIVRNKAGNILHEGLGIGDIVFIQGFHLDPKLQVYKRIGANHGDGTYSQFIKIKQSQLWKVPEDHLDQITVAQASGMTLVPPTAMEAAKRGKVGKNDSVLVFGLTGSTGAMFAQVAKRVRKARHVVGIGSKSERGDIAKQQGIIDAFVVRYGSQFEFVGDFKSKVLAANSDERYDVIFNSQGGETVQTSLDLLKPGGRLITIGNFMGNNVTTEGRKDTLSLKEQIERMDLQADKPILLALNSTEETVDARGFLKEMAKQQNIQLGPIVSVLSKGDFGLSDDQMVIYREDLGNEEPGKVLVQKLNEMFDGQAPHLTIHDTRLGIFESFLANAKPFTQYAIVNDTSKETLNLNWLRVFYWESVVQFADGTQIIGSALATQDTIARTFDAFYDGTLRIEPNDIEAVPFDKGAQIHEDMARGRLNKPYGVVLITVDDGNLTLAEVQSRFFGTDDAAERQSLIETFQSSTELLNTREDNFTVELPEEGTVVVTFDNKEKGHAVSVTHMQQRKRIDKRLERYARARYAKGKRTAVIRTMKSSAGAYINDFVKARDEAFQKGGISAAQKAVYEFGNYFHEEVLAHERRLWNEIGLLSISAVQGKMVGGGAELTYESTLVLMDEENGSIGQPEITLGVLGGAGGVFLLPFKVGLINALTIAFSGAPVKAPVAKQIGMVDGLSKKGQVVTDSKAIAQRYIDKDEDLTKQFPQLAEKKDWEKLKKLQLNSVEYEIVKNLYQEMSSRLQEVLAMDHSSDEFAAKMEDIHLGLKAWLAQQILAYTGEGAEDLREDLMNVLDVAFATAVPKRAVGKNEYKRLTPKGENKPITRIRAMLASFETILYSYEQTVDESRKHAMEVFAELAVGDGKGNGEGERAWNLFVARKRKTLVPVMAGVVQNLKDYTYDGGREPKIGSAYVSPEAMALRAKDPETALNDLRDFSAKKIQQFQDWIGDSVPSIQGRTLAAYVTEDDGIFEGQGQSHPYGIDGGLNIRVIRTGTWMSNRADLLEIITPQGWFGINHARLAENGPSYIYSVFETTNRKQSIAELNANGERFTPVMLVRYPKEGYDVQFGTTDEGELFGLLQAYPNEQIDVVYKDTADTKQEGVILERSVDGIVLSTDKPVVDGVVVIKKINTTGDVLVDETRYDVSFNRDEPTDNFTIFSSDSPRPLQSIPHEVFLTFQRALQKAAESNRQLAPFLGKLRSAEVQKVITESSSSPVAATATPGGIDLNENNLNLQTSGSGVDLNFDNSQLLNIQFDGIRHVIINIMPVPNLPLLLGMSDETEYPDSENTDLGLDPFDRRDPLITKEREQLSFLN